MDAIRSLFGGRKKKQREQGRAGDTGAGVYVGGYWGGAEENDQRVDGEPGGMGGGDAVAASGGDAGSGADSGGGGGGADSGGGDGGGGGGGGDGGGSS